MESRSHKMSVQSVIFQFLRGNVKNTVLIIGFFCIIRASEGIDFIIVKPAISLPVHQKQFTVIIRVLYNYFLRILRKLLFFHFVSSLARYFRKRFYYKTPFAS